MLDVFADLLVLIHLLWVIFMVAGVAATAAGVFYRPLLRPRSWRILHLAGMLFAGLLSVWGKLCPLTTWEYALRRAAGSVPGEETGFVIRLANRLIFPGLDSHALTWLTGSAAVIVLVIFVTVPPQGRTRRAGKREEAIP